MRGSSVLWRQQRDDIGMISDNFGDVALAGKLRAIRR
jgi:hypothetical protein